LHRGFEKNFRLLLAAFSCAVGLWIARVVAHDLLTYRSETDASTACFKAMFSCPINHTRERGHVELVQSSDERYRPKARALDDGNFSVALWYDFSSGPRAHMRLPVVCTMHCEGFDDWELIDVKIADEPPVVCHEQYSPTGIQNELWIYSWLDRTIRPLAEALRSKS
jgi:hypothetical protein